MLSSVNYEHLQQVALSARFRHQRAHNHSIVRFCTIDPSRFTYGFNNVVLEVSSSDNVFWIAKIQHSLADSSDASSNEDDLLGEIATMRTVKERTRIPVPQVFAFDLSPSNFVGHPYILMEHLDGQVLGGPIAEKVPPAHMPKVARQLADVLFQLESLTFDRLGRLWRGKSCDGPSAIVPVDPQEPTPKTSLEWFYMDRQENRRALEGHADDPEWKTACWVLKTAIPHIIIEDRLRGPFPLCHLDLHYGNLLFDDDYNLKGVIDWSHAQTVPLERLAVCPEFVTSPAGSDEVNESIVDLRSLVRQHLHDLEKKGPPPYGWAALTPLSSILGTERAEVAFRCTYILPQRTLAYGRLVARLIYKDKITWEQLVAVYGEAEMY